MEEDCLSDNSKGKNYIATIQYYVYRYIQEICEAFVAYTLFFIVKNKSIKTLDFKSTLYTSLFIGLVTLILEEYEPKYNSNLKTGMVVSIGTAFIKGQ